MLVGDVFRPFVDVFVRSDVPCFFKDKLIHERVAVESLECGADAAEVLSSVDERVFDAFIDFSDVAGEHRVAAEVAEVAPDVGHAVVSVGLLPDFLPLAVVVEQQLLLGRVGGDVRLDAVVRPVFPFVPEEPGHLQPHRVFVSSAQRFVHLSAHTLQVGRVIARRSNFVEQVDAVDMVCPVGLYLHVDEHLLHLLEERVHRVEKTG